MITSKVTKLNDELTAKKIGEFLTSTDAFTHVWYPGEKDMVKNAVASSLSEEKHQYWYVEEEGKIVGAVGVCANQCGGFEMDEDYIAVHKDYRRKGIATALLEKMESFVGKNEGRYIHISTCDIDSYAPARAFYEARGYKKTGEMPNYYNPGEGKVDYYKEIN